MNGNVVMKAKDTVFAGLAECFITIGTRRYNFMQAINLEAKFEKNKTEVPILGKTGRGNKASGWKGTGSSDYSSKSPRRKGSRCFSCYGSGSNIHSYSGTVRI